MSQNQQRELALFTQMSSVYSTSSLIDPNGSLLVDCVLIKDFQYSTSLIEQMGQSLNQFNSFQSDDSDLN